jgi:hypothetical protein
LSCEKEDKRSFVARDNCGFSSEPRQRIQDEGGSKGDRKGDRKDDRKGDRKDDRKGGALNESLTAWYGPDSAMRATSSEAHAHRLLLRSGGDQLVLRKPPRITEAISSLAVVTDPDCAAAFAADRSARPIAQHRPVNPFRFAPARGGAHHD